MMNPQRLAALAVLAALAPSAWSGTLFVDANLTTGLDDGSSWSNAYQGIDGLQAALAAAQPADQVFVADGVYRPSSSGVRSASFLMQSGVEIYGSFYGGEVSPDQRPPSGVAPSVLSGDLNGNDGSGTLSDNSFHVVNAALTNSSAVLDGFVITGGNSNAGGGNNDRGGGILCIGNVTPTVRNCDFVGNRCNFGGGAGYINGGAPSFTDCSFVDNVGGAFGGAFDIAVSGAVRFERCRFEGNSAGRAGALEIFATNGVVVLNCVFRANTATGASGGGAMWMGSGGSTTVRNSTFVANVANSQAVGGIRDQNTGATIQSCILWNNQGTGGAQGSANQLATNGNVSYSIVEGGFAGGTNLAGDPQFSDLAGGDFSLTLTSAAIDAGTNFQVPVSEVDFDGNPRLFDEPSVIDTGVGLPPIVDIGAFERVGAPPLTYCTAKTSSAGCVAQLTTSRPSGAPLSGDDDYTVIATTVQGAKNGLLFGGPSGAAAIPFSGGTLCVQPPTKRGPLVNSSGSSPTSCDGFFSTTVNDGQLLNTGAGLDAGPGNTGWYQYWYRDPQNGAGNLGTALSNGVQIDFL